MHASGQVTGQPGDSFNAGKRGEYTANEDGAVLLGKPTVFGRDNIEQADF